MITGNVRLFVVPFARTYTEESRTCRRAEEGGDVIGVDSIGKSEEIQMTRNV